MAHATPNILFIQADQLPSRFLSAYGHQVVKTPHLSQLAESGVVFDNCYCNFPLCAPSRFSMLSGLLASKIGAYDNGAEFPASIPTFTHALRLLGYETCLSGKMHFVGPDQLHGFESRLTTDVYPADFNWTADWTPRERVPTSEMGVVLNAGPVKRSIQVDFDDEACFLAERKIYDIGRDRFARPFFLTVSFTHPHDPFETPHAYWDRYRHDDIDLPRTGVERRDPHSRRLAQHFGIDEAPIDDEVMRRCRHAYYGSISFVDDKVGTLLNALSVAGLAENTVVIFAADHGEFMGERGLWFKRSFFEPSAHIPLIISAPGRLQPRRIAENVSLVDLFPTLVELAGGHVPELARPLDGLSLLPLMRGDAERWSDTVLGEILCECTTAPVFMVKRGSWKYVACQTDAAQLYDLSSDPDERHNRAGDPSCSKIEGELATDVAQTWNVPAITQDVLTSQRRRRLVNSALAAGRQTSWDYQPFVDASRSYYRGTGGGDATALIRRALAYGVMQSTSSGLVYGGHVIAGSEEEGARYLGREYEIANAIERQIREAAGRL